ncbi:ABC transporter I family member 19 [Nymphaea thermarum]|nr:ABC transporter I family member 19 [Nymphaea thermarum]
MDGEEQREGNASYSINVTGMNFAYQDQPPIFTDFNLTISPGSRCLLVGANGSGKTTLLRILAGKHMVGGRDVIRVLNSSAFHDTQLVCSGDLAYLGGSWSKNAGCAGEIPLQGDFSAKHMIFGVEGIDPARRDKLVELLDINLQWRMHKVSDGQRRRVQICLGLLRPFQYGLSPATDFSSVVHKSITSTITKVQVLLLDEVTVDLDIVARLDLLDFFKEECEQRGATVVYATHIFDGLETWATHLAYIVDGEQKRLEKLSELEELKTGTTLLSVAESWLRSESKDRRKKVVKPTSQQFSSSSPFDGSPFRSSRHMAYYR